MPRLFWDYCSQGVAVVVLPSPQEHRPVPVVRILLQSVPQYQDANELSEEVVVTNAQAEAEMSYEVSGLDVGTWYFTIQVQDTNGLISEPSDVVSKSIRS